MNKFLVVRAYFRDNDKWYYVFFLNEQIHYSYVLENAHKFSSLIDIENKLKGLVENRILKVEEYYTL